MAHVTFSVTCRVVLAKDCVGRKEFTVNKEALESYQRGDKLIQDAFPDMSPEDREMLISNTCPKCWDALFPEDDDE